LAKAEAVNVLVVNNEEIVDLFVRHLIAHPILHEIEQKVRGWLVIPEYSVNLGTEKTRFVHSKKFVKREIQTRGGTIVMSHGSIH
jgi:hypothetical protein